MPRPPLHLSFPRFLFCGLSKAHAGATAVLVDELDACHISPLDPAKLHAASAGHTRLAISATLTLDDSSVVLALQIKPELGTISKISTEPDGCISSDRPASIEYVRDATARYAEIEREPICTELARC